MADEPGSNQGPDVPNLPDDGSGQQPLDTASTDPGQPSQSSGLSIGDQVFDRSAAPMAQQDLDPANQSLADALKLSFRLLQLAMVVLIVFYIMTGWNTVEEQDNGLRLTFGRIQNTTPLDRGLHLSWPYPVGEFIKVRIAPRTVELKEAHTDDQGQPVIREAFWLGLSREESSKPFEQVNRRLTQGLVPGEDGSVITSDSNLAHTRWQVTYIINDPMRLQATVLDSEGGIDPLVRRCVERGVVRACAGTGLDDVIQSRDLLNARVKAFAQELLDKLDCGIVIQSANCTEARPPRQILESYEGVSQAWADAHKAIETATDEATRIMNRVAGRYHTQLAGLIRVYEAVYDGVQPDESDLDRLATAYDEDRAALAARLDTPERVLAEIDAILRSPDVAGTVAEIISNAESERTRIVTRAQESWRLFDAYRDQYREDPALVAYTLWAETLQRIYAGNIEIFSIPPGMKDLDLWLNRDPQLQENWRRERARRQINE
ncbi:MAG: hypothetical protein HND57_06885 [Planctomycetes bacterium]|nr:hypothetical protein [Planctomycetota bacterium]